VTPPTVARALTEAQAAGVDRLDAQRLLAHHLRRPRAWLIAHPDASIPQGVADAWEADLARCSDEVPLAYLLGEHEFHGLRLKVNRDVLVPRADTEVLVDWALEVLADLAAPGPEVVDLGTGSGAIALAVAHRWPRAVVTATDSSAAALDVARANAHRLGLEVEFAVGSWWHAVPPGRTFDLALANPPYIACDDPHLAGLRHEPRLALTPGGDGLAAIRAIVAGAIEYLRPGAWLLLEHGWQQADAVRALLADAGLVDVVTRRDFGQRWRCSGARRPGPPGTGASPQQAV
jgi:release factor glutamine methyltransferase